MPLLDPAVGGRAGPAASGSRSAAASGASGSKKDQPLAGKRKSPPTPGTQVTNEAKLKEDFGDEVVSEQPLLAGGSAATTNAITLALGESQAAVGAQKCLRLWLRNTSTRNVTLPVSTLFVSLVSKKLEDDKDKFACRYTRLTGYKKDIAECQWVLGIK